jgi:DNA-binding NarL/FixJ family response regulator
VPCRVVILYQFPLIGRAIEQLLEAAKDIEVIACLSEEPDGWAQAEALQPDVVVEEYETEGAPASLPTLPLGERLNLICLRSQGNEMCLYQAQHLSVTGPDDLAQVIRASSARPEIELNTRVNILPALAAKKEIAHESLD